MRTDSKEISVLTWTWFNRALHLKRWKKSWHFSSCMDSRINLPRVVFQCKLIEVQSIYLPFCTKTYWNGLEHVQVQISLFLILFHIMSLYLEKPSKLECTFPCNIKFLHILTFLCTTTSSCTCLSNNVLPTKHSRTCCTCQSQP